MMIVWALSAEQDRADIVDFIALDKPLAAVRMDELFAAAAGRLGEHALLDRPGQIAGTRGLIPRASCRTGYQVRDDAVWILAVLHTAWMWPPRPR